MSGRVEVTFKESKNNYSINCYYFFYNPTDSPMSIGWTTPHGLLAAGVSTKSLYSDDGPFDLHREANFLKMILSSTPEFVDHFFRVNRGRRFLKRLAFWITDNMNSVAQAAFRECGDRHLLLVGFIANSYLNTLESEKKS